MSVQILQSALNARGANPELAVDGDFGPATETAVKSFQSAYFVDGVAGPQTNAALGIPNNETLTEASTAQIAESAVDYTHYTSSYTLSVAVAQALALAGVSGDAANVAAVNLIEAHESGGNTNAVNDYDLNATGPDVADGYPQNCSRGLMQTIPSTFAQYHAAGTSNSIYDPVANIAAAVRYAVATYGSLAQVPGVVAVEAGRDYVGY